MASARTRRCVNQRRCTLGVHGIPALNEALNIADCVRHALNSRWPRPRLWWMIASDGTREVGIAASGQPNLRIVEGTDTTDGRANHGPVFEPAKSQRAFIVH